MMRHPPAASLFLLLLLALPAALAIQQLQVNEVRERLSLDGLWTFVREQRNGGDAGIAAGWNTRELSQFQNATVMPVPSAYNDLGDSAHRDHVGWVWYEKYEYVPARLAKNNRIFLRFDSINYYSIVYVNSKEVTRHEGGHQQFEVEVTDQLRYDKPNKFTVAINNTLSWFTIPPGDFIYTTRVAEDFNNTQNYRYPPGHFTMTGTFDYFNYAGIMRPVALLVRPRAFIDDFYIDARQTGDFNFSIAINGADTRQLKLYVNIFDAKGKRVFADFMDKGGSGKGRLENAQLWYPRGLGEPYLYTFEAKLVAAAGVDIVDVFRVRFGFRTISWDIDGVYFNGRRFYCMGVGYHEESAIRGRSFDRVIMSKDLELFEWLGVNCFRTSHYPYSEETMLETDRRGFAVIVEVPSVSIQHYNDIVQAKHADRIREMIANNRNHPSVFAWSVANEPFTQLNGGQESRPYFKPLIELARQLDPSRAVTLVHGQGQYNNDHVSDFLDIICVNRYYGWYQNMDDADQIHRSLYIDLHMWRETYKKALIFTEYGAEHIPGLIMDPPMAFTAQYQERVLLESHKALEKLRKEHVITGECAWVFADFMTHSGTTRAVGNHKGLFTRDRQPKSSAYIIQKRYNDILKGGFLNETVNSIPLLQESAFSIFG